MRRSSKHAPVDATLSRFLKQTRNALAKSACFCAENRQNPLTLRRHFGSVQTILERFHEFQPLFTDDEDGLLAANLVVSLSRWPAGWDVFYIWKNELEFSIKTYRKTGRVKLEAETAYLLAELYSARGAEGDLRHANRWAALAVKKAYIAEDAHIIGRAVFIRMQILFRSPKNKIIPVLYQRAFQSISEISPDADSRLVALAFLCIPYARFLHRSGETKKAIQSITEFIDHLHPRIGLDIDIHKELYDLRGVLHCADGNYRAALDDFDLEYALLNHKPDVEIFDNDQNDMDALFISVFANRAIVFNTLGKFREAEKMTCQAIELSRKINAFSLLMRQTGDVAWNHFCRGELEQALESIEEQFRMARMANDADQEYLAIYNRASIRTFAGQAQDAYPDFLNLLKIFKRRNNVSVYVGLLIDISICYWKLGELKTAARYHRQARGFIARQHLETFEFGILRSGALFENRPDAKSHLEQALHLARKSNRKYDEAACLLHLAYLDEFDAKQAYWRDAIVLLEDMGALAWVEHKSPDDFVLLPFFSA